MYPVKQEEIIPILEKQGMFGHLQEREVYWYFWAGFMFFKLDSKFNKEIDFGPGAVNGVNLDTGGLVYKPILADVNKEKLVFPKQEYKRIREGDLIQSDQMEFIGNWMHSFNGSYWIKIPNKEAELERIVNNFLK
jgi:hypothetical protein